MIPPERLSLPVLSGGARSRKGQARRETDLAGIKVSRSINIDA